MSARLVLWLLLKPANQVPASRSFRGLLHRGDLVVAVVIIKAGASLLPTRTEASLLPRCADVGSINLEVESQMFSQLIDEEIGLREVVARVGEDNGNVGYFAAEQVQRYRSLNPKARTHDMSCREIRKRPLNSFSRRHGGELFVALGQGLLPAFRFRKGCTRAHP